MTVQPGNARYVTGVEVAFQSTHVTVDGSWPSRTIIWGTMISHMTARDHGADCSGQGGAIDWLRDRFALLDQHLAGECALAFPYMPIDP